METFKFISMYSPILTKDLDCLMDQQWLNDTCIEFAFEYFENEKFKNQLNDFAFVRPAIAYLMAQIEDSKSLDGVVPPGLRDKKYIFIPINDNEGDRAGGFHW
jgi:Ulp1 family protease